MYMRYGMHLQTNDLEGEIGELVDECSDHENCEHDYDCDHHACK